MHLSKLMWLTTVIAALAGLLGIQVEGNQIPVAGASAPVVSFAFHHGGMSTFDIYAYMVEMDEASGEQTVNYELFCGYETYMLPADAELLQELAKLVDDYNLRKWDGFDKVNSHVLDGSSFDLEIRFGDGTSITASGSNRFPEGYSDAKTAVDDLFHGYLMKYGIEAGGGIR